VSIMKILQEVQRGFAEVERALRLPETYPAWCREVRARARWRDFAHQ
jgi:hypothetical protein